MSVCSGIGAPEISAPWIDWRYQSEIEPFPCAVLAHRFPEATNLGDMTKCGYGWSYRLLDAQYVRTSGFPRAVPQRRRRVFVVGYLGDWRPAAAEAQP